MPWRLQSRRARVADPRTLFFLVVVVRLCRTTTTRKNYLGSRSLPKPHRRSDFATAMSIMPNILYCSKATCIIGIRSVNYECEHQMQTAVTKRGQTVIPAPIRKRYQIHEGDSLVWIDDGESIRVIPVAQDPIRALRGSGRGEQLTERLLAQRQEDRARE